MFSYLTITILCIFHLNHLALLVSAQAPVLGQPGTAVTNEELNATYTHLVGFEECDLTSQYAIVNAFWDAARLLNTPNVRHSHPSDDGVDWGSPAAVEFLASPLNSPYRANIQALYNQAATFEPSYIHWPTDFTINARCDDPKQQCTCHNNRVLDAYTTNEGGSNNNGPYMNFCPQFFETPNLHTALGQAQRAPFYRYDASNWENQAEIFMHEMFHIDRIANAPPNLHVTDPWIQWDDNRYVQVYGVEETKILARTLNNPGAWVIQAAESLMYFVMVTFYQSQLGGEYPSRPFCQDVPNGPPRRHRHYSAFDFSNGTLKVYNASALDNAPQATSAASATCVTEPIQSNNTFNAMTAAFAVNSDYPADYQSSLSSWMSTWDAYWATADGPSGAGAASPTSSTGPTATSGQSSATPTAETIDTCGDKYEFFLDHFTIQGKNFNAAKFGADGSGLKKQIQGCGALTKWKFNNTLNDSKYQWSASGDLPIGTKGCVGRAVVSAGGATADGCTGAG